MKKIEIVLAILLIFGFTSVSWALPLLNETSPGSGSYYDTYPTSMGGESYGIYTNSGTLINEVQSGNISDSAADMEYLEGWIEDALGYDSSFELVETATTYTPADGNTGTWATAGLADISFYLVKASSAWALYLVDPADSTGSYSTFDIWSKGYGGNDGVNISHLDGFNPTAPVPEPATMLLLGTGLLGIAVTGRKKFKK